MSQGAQQLVMGTPAAAFRWGQMGNSGAAAEAQPDLSGHFVLGLPRGCVRRSQAQSL